MLIMIMGLPGTGKTTFARSLALGLKGVHLNTDIVRDHLGLRGQYDEDTKNKVYKALLEQAKTALEEGQVVVVDGTFFKKELRRPFLELSEVADSPIRWIEIKASESVIKERVSQSREYSEADFDVYLKIKKAYEPLEEKHLVLHSDEDPIDEMIAKTQAFYPKIT